VTFFDDIQIGLFALPHPGTCLSDKVHSTTGILQIPDATQLQLVGKIVKGEWLKVTGRNQGQNIVVCKFSMVP